MSENARFEIKEKLEGLNYARYTIEPLDPGYGTTLGNALRRILLRSLEGVAVSRVRIDNVWHEFSTIPNVREDVTEVVLNLKRIRLRRLTELNGDTRAQLYAKGEGENERVVTAGDVSWPSEVEIINPDQIIATLDGAEATLDMDLWVSRNRGYQPAETQASTALGEIPIDAIYTPIEKVNFVVEHTRVGQNVDFDRLILEIVTDGTVEPDDALANAARILMDHARIFAEFNSPVAEQPTGAVPALSDEVMNRQLADLGLSPRVLNALRSKGINTIGDVLLKDPDELLSIRNFGPQSLKDLRDRLAEFGALPEEGGAAYNLNGTDEASERQGAADGGEDDPETLDVAEAIASLRGDTALAGATATDEERDQ